MYPRTSSLPAIDSPDFFWGKVVTASPRSTFPSSEVDGALGAIHQRVAGFPMKWFEERSGQRGTRADYVVFSTATGDSSLSLGGDFIAESLLKEAEGLGMFSSGRPTLLEMWYAFGSNFDLLRANSGLEYQSAGFHSDSDAPSVDFPASRRVTGDFLLYAPSGSLVGTEIIVAPDFRSSTRGEHEPISALSSRIATDRNTPGHQDWLRYVDDGLRRGTFAVHVLEPGKIHLVQAPVVHRRQVLTSSFAPLEGVDSVRVAFRVNLQKPIPVSSDSFENAGSE